MTISDIVPALLNSLVDSRVWESETPDELPRSAGEILPFIIWTLHGGMDAEYVEQSPAPAFSNARVQIHVVARSGQLASQLMKAASDALLASSYTVGVYGSPVGTNDSARRLKGRRQQFSIWFQQ